MSNKKYTVEQVLDGIYKYTTSKINERTKIAKELDNDLMLIFDPYNMLAKLILQLSDRVNDIEYYVGGTDDSKTTK